MDHRLEAALVGVVEDRLMRVPLGTDTQGGAEDVLHGRVRDATGDPLDAELIQRDVPDLLVVRVHEEVADPLPEPPQAPAMEVVRFRRALAPRELHLDVIPEAGERVPGLEVSQAVFERVLDVAPLEIDEGLAVGGVVPDVVDQALDELEHLLVLAEHDVPTRTVSHEPVDDLAAAKAAASICGLEAGDVMPLLHQEVGRHQARDAAAQYHDLHSDSFKRPAFPGSIDELTSSARGPGRTER